MARTINAVNPNHGADRLFLPCANNSPKLGDPGGNPRPRKSRDVSAVIDPDNTNGNIANVATTAFGNTCRHMMTGVDTPNAFAART